MKSNLTQVVEAIVNGDDTSAKNTFSTYLKQNLTEMVSKPLKNSKAGIVIGRTKNGGDITVHGVKHDTNGNWVYKVMYPPRNRKISVQHMAAAGHKTAIRDLNEFKNKDANAKAVAKEVVKYINKFMLK